jgi:APA family basic amino acid/polyamine antiporter
LGWNNYWAGLFSLTGIAVLSMPVQQLHFHLFAAVGCAFAGLCYAEFASMIPVAGSAYTYSYATMGEFMAWIIGWDLVLEYIRSRYSWVVSSIFTELLNKYGIHLPHDLIYSLGNIKKRRNNYRRWNH